MTVPLLLALLAGAASAVGTIHPDDIRPGMKGYGLSVFRGQGVERFEVVVIDVMYDISPRRDMILARLTGMGLEESGIIAGMSGSPVYLDGRLAGAVAYGWAFSKEPIAGITPIGEMLELWEIDRAAPGGSPRFSPAGPDGSGLSRLPVPLAVTGYSPRLARVVEPELTRYGFPVLAGAGVAGLSAEVDSALVPGGAVGVVLIDGDVRMSVIGTLTHREGARILAFGHPMLEAGATEMPLCSGVIHTILPSFYESFKLFSTTGLVGTMTQDRLPGIGGVLGPAPAMLPVQVEIRSPAARTSYEFRVITHRAILPLLVAIGLVDIVLSTEGTYEPMTLRSDMTVAIEDTTRLTVSHIYAGDEPAAMLFQTLIGELYGMLNGRFRSPQLSGVSFSLDFEPGISYRRIVSARPDRRVVEPGDTVTLALTLRDPEEHETTRTVSIALPRTVPPGELLLAVAPPDTLLYRETMRAPALTEPKSLARYLELLARTGRENELVVAGYTRRPGLTIGNTELTAPPPSLRAVILGTEDEEPIQASMESPLFRYSFRFDEVLAGAHEIRLEVRR